MAALADPRRQRLQRAAHRQSQPAYLIFDPGWDFGVDAARPLSAELLPHGIRMNGLSPGPVSTPALGKLGLNVHALSALPEEIKNQVPPGRMGTP